MKVYLALLLVSTAVLLLTIASQFVKAGEYAKHTQLDDENVDQVVKLLKKASLESESSRRAGLLRQAKKLLKPGHFAINPLISLQNDENPDKSIEELIESLTFRPWMEAQLPAGFPEFTPVNHMEVKLMPKYRKASVDMNAGGKGRSSGGFWSLFNHIKRNEIKMTAPVQIDYEQSESKSRKQSMSFLYANTRLGDPGEDPQDQNILVDDVEKHKVIAIGVRGEMTRSAVMVAREKLLNWLDINDQYDASGSIRTMGYNSPFVPSRKKYFEVQIPVTEKMIDQTLN